MTRKELILQMLTELEPELFDSPIHIEPSKTIKGGTCGYDIIIRHAKRKGKLQNQRIQPPIIWRDYVTDW